MIQGCHYRIILRRNGQKVSEQVVPNSLVREGMEEFANILFAGDTVGSTTWSFGLIDGDGFTELDVEDSLSSHPGWTEITDYARQEWVSGDYDEPTKSIPTEDDEDALWEFTAKGLLKGVFLTNGSIILSEAEIAEIEFFSGDTLEVTYTLWGV